MGESLLCWSVCYYAFKFAIADNLKAKLDLLNHLEKLEFFKKSKRIFFQFNQMNETLLQQFIIL